MEIVWNVSHEIPRSLDGILQKLHVFVMFFPCGMKILWNILHRFPAIIKLGPICRETPRNISHEMPWSPHGVFMFFFVHVTRKSHTVFRITWSLHGKFHTFFSTQFHGE